MSNIEQPSSPSVPLLRGSEEQVIKLRKRLEDVFRNVSHPIYRAKQRGASAVVQQRVTEIATQLASTGTFSDPARTRLLETRKTVLNAWLHMPTLSTSKANPFWRAMYVISHVTSRVC